MAFRTDKSDIEALKAGNPILEVAHELGLVVIRQRFRCLRPENHHHGDRTPSVSVSAERGNFKCWVCPDVKGDVIDLVRLVRNCTFAEALRWLQGRRGTTPSPTPSATDSLSHTQTPGSINASPARATDSPHAPPTRPRAAFPGSTDTSQSIFFSPSSAHGHRSAHPDDEPSLFTTPIEAEPKRAAVPALAADGLARPAPGPDAPLIPSSDIGPLRREILESLLALCPPVEGPVARYLQKRRVFKRTWEKQKLRMIDDYSGISRKLEVTYGLPQLAQAGLFNPSGHLRYYKHRLLFPYYDADGRAVYVQARAIDSDTKPKELSLAGPIPIPYNSVLLNGEPGQIYLCEGVIDTLTLIEQGFPAVGIPGAGNFKPAWTGMFRNKTVHVAFDPDAPGEAGAARVMDLFKAADIEVRRLTPPGGMDLNDWLRKG